MRVAVVALLAGSANAFTVLITGATGRTGAMIYSELKFLGVTVRGLVRNVDKAKARLDCGDCGEAEGIFVGDITKPDTLAKAMAGADTLLITTGPAYKCTVPQLYIGCKFLPGADPKTVAWEGVRNQVRAFASSRGPALKNRHVVLLSNDMTTTPDNFLDKIDNAHGCFYALNGEVFTMSSGVPFTIIKANGLNDGGAGEKEIVIGHDDKGWNGLNPNFMSISRKDLARLLLYTVMHPEKTTGLRFDVTSKAIGGTPTADVAAVFKAAEFPWDPRGQTATLV